MRQARIDAVIERAAEPRTAAERRLGVDLDVIALRIMADAHATAGERRAALRCLLTDAGAR